VATTTDRPTVARDPLSGAGFRSMRFKYLLGPNETLQSQPGSNLLATRVVSLVWQDETLGITTLLNGAWSSVPQR
jgi:hypothetical protein